MMLHRVRAGLAVSGLLALLAGPVAAQDINAAQPPQAEAAVFSTIYRFHGGALGHWPRGGVAIGAGGTVFGTTLYDGNCTTCGVIYRLDPPAHGKTVWTYKVLHKFVMLKEGIAPTGPLTYFKGNLYGTTSAGGDPSCGCGTVFKITPAGSFTTLHVFKNRNQGSTPISGLLIDTAGNMYGNTDSGGQHGAGVIYKLTPAGGYTILHHFAGNLNGGPQGEMIFGHDGAIYGTQFGGGKYNQGVIFRMTKAGAYTVLYNFLGVNQPGNSTDGANPEGRLVQAADGTIYGTTTFGGTPSGYGTAWSIKQNGAKWTYKQIFIFGKQTDANIPHSGLIAGPTGIFYGTGAGGGAMQSGALYQLTKPATANGAWGYKTLHSFKDRDPNGDTPYGVITRINGLIHGMNLTGGIITMSGSCINGCGTLFTYKP